MIDLFFLLASLFLFYFILFLFCYVSLFILLLFILLVYDAILECSNYVMNRSAFSCLYLFIYEVYYY